MIPQEIIDKDDGEYLAWWQPKLKTKVAIATGKTIPQRPGKKYRYDIYGESFYIAQKDANNIRIQTFTAFNRRTGNQICFGLTREFCEEWIKAWYLDMAKYDWMPEDYKKYIYNADKHDKWLKQRELEKELKRSKKLMKKERRR